MTKKEQRWYCEKCDKNGGVHYKKGAGIYEVINLIEDSHNQVSPKCNNNRMNLQIFNEKGLEGLSIEEQNKIKSKFGLI